jgi:hypothetical protein
MRPVGSVLMSVLHRVWPSGGSADQGPPCARGQRAARSRGRVEPAAAGRLSGRAVLERRGGVRRCHARAAVAPRVRRLLPIHLASAYERAESCFVLLTLALAPQLNSAFLWRVRAPPPSAAGLQARSGSAIKGRSERAHHQADGGAGKRRAARLVALAHTLGPASHLHGPRTACVQREGAQGVEQASGESRGGGRESPRGSVEWMSSDLPRLYSSEPF